MLGSLTACSNAADVAAPLPGVGMSEAAHGSHIHGDTCETTLGRTRRRFQPVTGSHQQRAKEGEEPNTCHGGDGASYSISLAPVTKPLAQSTAPADGDTSSRRG